MIELAEPSTVYRDVRPSLRGPDRGGPAPSPRSAVSAAPSLLSHPSLPASVSARPSGGAKRQYNSTDNNRPHSKLSLAKTPEPDPRQSSPVARESPTCKKRPDSKKAARSKGGGGGKKFIPWCS